MTDTEIRKKGLKILSKSLGKVEAERFIALINRETFDYTEWQQQLWNEYSVRDLSKAATKHQKKTAKK